MKGHTISNMLCEIKVVEEHLVEQCVYPNIASAYAHGVFSEYHPLRHRQASAASSLCPGSWQSLVEIEAASLIALRQQAGLQRIFGVVFWP